MVLTPKDIVLIVSPAGRVLNENIDDAVKILESWDLKVEVGAFAKCEHHNFSGTMKQRLNDLQWALDHSEAKAIFASRGGYGAIHLLDKLDWSGFQKNPKILIGYSDICNLHPTIHKFGFPSLHGLMPNSFPKGNEHQQSLETLKKALFNLHYEIQWEDDRNQEDFEIEGEIVGGNLSILYCLQGTPYAPDYNGKILFLEDLCEYLYHTDRMLNSFALAGVFSQIKGIVVGDFSDMKDNDRPFGKSIAEMFQAISEKYKIPVVYGLHTGHSDPTLALPLGKMAKLTVSNKRSKLEFYTKAY